MIFFQLTTLCLIAILIFRILSTRVALVRSHVFHLPLIRHKFSEYSLQYCLIKAIKYGEVFCFNNKLSTNTLFSILQCLKQKAIDLYSDHRSILQCYVCQNLSLWA